MLLPLPGRLPPRPPFGIETLEPRRLWSVSLDADGNTVVTPGAGDRVIYVSASGGNDASDGSSPTAAVRSLQRGYGMLRNGHADQLLLHRGDTWHETLPGWTRSGVSADRPMVLGAYGDGARPTIASDGNVGFVANGSGVSHVVVQGVHFAATARDPSSPDYDAGSLTRIGIGFSLTASGGDWLVEDCEISDFSTNVAVQGGRQSNVRFRDNVIRDAYAPASTHSEGVYVDGVRGLLLEGNVIDHNGWSESVPGAPATMFNHNIYLTSDVTDAVVTGNVISNASSHGLQARSGGQVLDNLFVANPIQMSYGLVRGDGSPTAGGVSGVVNGNVFLGTRDIDGQVRGVGIEVANTAADAPTLLSNNIFSNVSGNGVSWQQGGFAAILLSVGSGQNDAALAAGLNDLKVQGNLVHGWAKGISFQSGMSAGGGGTNGYSGLSVKANEFSHLAGPAVEHLPAFDGSFERWTGNRFDGADARPIQLQSRTLKVSDWPGAGSGDRSGLPPYVDADRSLSDYAQTIGLSDAKAVLATLRGGQGGASRATAAAVVAYVRGGFENPDPSAARRNWSPPTPPTAEATLPATVRTDETGLLLTVTYRDDEALDTASIGDGDVELVHGNRKLSASLQSVTPSADGREAVVTYRVASPNATWRAGDRGLYKVSMVDGQVRDAEGFAVEAGVVGSNTVEVQVVPPPPKVLKSVFKRGRGGAPDTVVLRLSGALAVTPAVADLSLSPVAPLNAKFELPAAPDLSSAAVQYDAEKGLLVWTLPTLGPGRYAMSLQPTTLQSIDGKTLDGNGDGLAGDAFVRAKPIVVKAIASATGRASQS